ncbi:radical SAM protein [Methanococcoides sp. SA1]|nr:radical SAM protein [Methanococcoides sp. SA1]
MYKQEIIPSVNFHLWEPCNMSCKFCFASFQDVKKTILPKGHLPHEEAIAVVKQLADLGFEKITFAGGEPTLCPWLPELIRLAKDLGMTTMLVTNGSRLTDKFLEKNRRSLDWIAISIDSLNCSTNSSIGRTLLGKHALSADYYDTIIQKIKFYGYGLKINTVVNRYNYQEDMLPLIQKANPKRWKVLQVLPIKGQNDKEIDDMKISREDFQLFIDTHKAVKCMIPEDNEAMIGSYVMVDPAGRFFDDTSGFHNYSQSILKQGAYEAIKEMNYDFEKFILREGVYDWAI